MRKFLSTLVLCSAGLLSGSFSEGAFAQTNFIFDSSTTGCTVNGTTGTASSTCVSGGVTATVQAWSNTGSGGAFAQAQLAQFGINGFGAYSGVNEGSSAANGYGVAYENQHAFDSITTGCAKEAGNNNTATANGGCGGSQELMLINFGSAKVDLTSVALGFCGTSPKECDLSVLRWDGAASGPNLATNGLAGWTLVNSQDVGNTGSTFGYSSSSGSVTASSTTVSLGAQVSSWWIVSTYYGATTSNLDAGNDRFKVLAIGANVCSNSGSAVNGASYNNGTCGTVARPVAEPGSLALAGLALFGAYAIRRKPTMKAVVS